MQGSGSNYAFGGGGSGSGAGTVITGPLSGFGELETVTPSPTAQVAFVYGLNPVLVTSYTYGAGSAAGVSSGELVLASGTTATSYARLISKKVAKYRPGQATMARWTARFSAGTVGNRQMAGLYNIEGGYQFGYRDDVFGILYTESATAEVQTLTVTAAPTSAGNVTVTLDGGPGVAVAVTNQPVTAITASEIASANYSQASGGWDAQAVGNVVYFTRRLPGPAGASTFAAGGVTGIAGTFAILTVGVAATEQFIAQTAWNQDKMNGTGASGVLLAPTKGNVYEVQFQYLGYGDAFFYVVSGLTGRPVLVHIVQNANARVSPNLRNPNLYLTWETRNTGTAASVSMRAASGGTFVEGLITYVGAQFAVQDTVTLTAGVETPILSLRGSNVYQNRMSTAQLQIDRISVACDGTKTVAFRVYKNGVLTSPRWQHVNPVTSAASYDADATGFSIGTGALIYAFSVSKTGNTTESVTDLVLFLQAGDVITVTGTSANASDVTAAIVWIEDV